MNYLIIGLIALEMIFQFRARLAVVGSHQRYVMLSLRRVSSWLVNIAFLGEGVLQLAIGQPGSALWDIGFGVLCIWVEIRGHRNDDDWFNGRGTKIKRGVKKFLTTPVRTPASAPAPAFG
jgi:hypothetical protein